MINQKMTNKEAIDWLYDMKHDIKYDEQVDALDIAIECIYKQIPKKPKIINYSGKKIPYCPHCKELLIKYADEDYRDIFGYNWRYMNYCDDCGQAIDWSDDNDD